MNTTNDTLMEIVHLASAALAADTDEIKRQATADIAVAIGGRVGMRETAETEKPTAAEPQGRDKFLTVSPGVRLIRFHGKDEIKLVARRVGKSGNPNTLFEIMVDKAAKVASVWRDSKILFEIKGVNARYSLVEAMAISALKRWFKERRPSKHKRAAMRRLREGILTPDEELADTIARQKEVAE